MIKMKDTFGLSRVVEPKNAVPVTAWKIDNTKEISPSECRIAINLIHLEPDCFQQLCNECGFDETKIIAKILDIVNRRGKLHNPFTNTAGQFYGVIDQMGSEYQNHTNYKIGDAVSCLTSMTALPIHIEEIQSINYNFCELIVKGYGIIFLDSPLTSLPNEIDVDYAMVALDEAANFHYVYHASKDAKRFLLIGKDLLTSIFYAASIKKAVQKDCYITVVLDEDATGMLQRKEAHRELLRWADSAYILNVTQPIESAETVMNKEEALYDMTVNCEDLIGSEAMSVILTKDQGQLYFTSLKNSYIQSNLIAESMGKEIAAFVLGQYVKDIEEQFTYGLLSSIAKEIQNIVTIYRNHPASVRKDVVDEGLNVTEKSGKAGDFVFSSSKSGALVREALNIAKYDCNVILQGETGVGKEKILELIHKNSMRQNKPCVKINCATIQENLAESEFFGYEAGAFTGAHTAGKKGYFEQANGGVIFLDEIGMLSLNLQSKLLRVLQESQFYKVGGVNPVTINVRVICANNIPLRQLVEQGKFREDLFYRLNICTITVPPLRERREDISVLAQSFLSRFCRQYGTDKEMDPSAMIRLACHDWPGNVRELENVIHRIVIGVKEYVITGQDVEAMLNETVYEDLVIQLKQKMRISAELDFNQIIEQQEIQLLEYALKKFGSTRKAAEFLNMSQPQLMRKKQKYNIQM